MEKIEMKIMLISLMIIQIILICTYGFLLFQGEYILLYVWIIVLNSGFFIMNINSFKNLEKWNNNES